MRAAYFEEAGGILRCGLCPHGCRLAAGARGICGVRANVGGEPALPYYGMVSSIALDPIEKKPLYHYYPGSSVLSFGFTGCNLKCPFCQNHRISQDPEAPAKFLSSAEAVELCADRNATAIAYTYSEPIVHAEWVLETMALSRNAGIKNVLVTNGYAEPGPAADLLALTDAVNVDLKSFDPAFYEGELKGGLEPVLDFIRLAAKGTHLEVTTLVIPGKNDSDGEIDGIASFIASLSQDIPLHLSCYFPAWKYRIQPTDADRLRALVEVARKHLRFVYPGNIRQESNTLCPSCDSIVVRRMGYFVDASGLMENKCQKCGTVLPFVNWSQGSDLDL